HYVHSPCAFYDLQITSLCRLFTLFFFNDPATPEIYTLSLHDALPICPARLARAAPGRGGARGAQQKEQAGAEPLRDLVIIDRQRSEEHTSELQSLAYLVCRLLLEKKKKKTRVTDNTCRQSRPSSI